MAKEAFAIAANGVTRYGLTQEGIKGLQLWLPDLSTQKRIAAFLDRETARIDELIAKKGGLVSSLRAKLKRAISAAVTDGLDADAPGRDSGIDWIGKIPAHWSLMKLGYLGRCANGINIGGDAFGSGYPFISYGDVYKNRELPVSVAGLVQSTEADRKAYSVIAGDVLFTRTSETIEEVGFSSVCMTTIEDAVFAGFLIRFRPNKNQLSPLFSKYAFQHMGLRDYFAKEMNLITRASLSQDLLRNMPVPLPPLEEQRAIGEHLGRLERQIEAIIEKTLETISKLKERRAALITAAVTGQIDVDTYGKAGTTSEKLDQIEKELQ
jgi:type I restriction enzyme S subunit